MNILLVFIVIFLFLIIVFFICEFFNIIFRGYAPFISTKSKLIKRIIDGLEYKNSENFTVYELGCGQAGFLRAFEKRCPQSKLFGIENLFLPWLIAKIQTSLSKSNIKIIKKNLFKVDLSEANLIYCYLNQKMIKKLADKFKQECKPGTKIISYAFSLPNQKADKEIELENKNKIFFYTLQK